MNNSSKKVFATLIMITLFSLGLLLYHAYRVFPAQSDAGHFVQNGVAMANGLREKPDPFWALMPQHIVKTASQRGLDSLKSLQLFTVFCGALITLGTGLLAWTLTSKAWAAILASLLVATNFSLIDISGTGLSEPGYLACLLMGSSIWLMGFSGDRKLPVLIGALIMAGAYFFKPYETIIYVSICIFVQLCNDILRQQLARKKVLHFISIAIFVAGGAFYFHEADKLGVTDSSQTKVFNLVWAVTGFDSKVNRTSMLGDENASLNAEKERIKNIGPVMYLWQNREQFARVYARNLASSLRHLNNQFFYGAFRAGFGWFLLLGICVTGYLIKNKLLSQIAIPLLMLIAIPCVLSIGLAYERWMIQCIPFMTVIISVATAHYLSSSTNRPPKFMALFAILVFCGLNIRAGIIFTGDKWRQNNILPAAKELRKWAKEEDILMTFGPSFPVSFYRTNTLNFVEIPYGTLGQTDQYAAEKKVNYIIFSDTLYRDYPLVKAKPGQPDWPGHWELLTNMVFNKSTRFGEEQETFTFIKINR